MAAKFVLKNSKDQFMFNLKAPNGEPILTSERYTSKAGALKGIESVRKNSSDDDQFERKESSNGQNYFILKAKNNEPIGKSEMYTTKAGMENGIKSVKENAPSAEIEDLTE
jgi:uncharacterized protein YegP (UPF0339 family)